MFNPDLSNQQFRLAAELVNNTSQHIFLTGKAGSGKTTFLKYIKETTQKNCAVVAPTGVAAINAGGVTMHSFFQLPFEPFLPVRGGLQTNAANQSNLFSKIQLSSVKREVMEELELLIIDEVSMVRCDQLDAIDTILRGVRRQYQTPFGGVQVLFIGDMYQLPPVIKDEEWQLLNEHYTSPFFFHSKVIETKHPLYIELKKIYRQKEEQFIELLNHIRNNHVDEIDFELLHSRYDPYFKPSKEEKYITITTHNYKADIINQEELKHLQAEEFLFTGEIVGDFSDKMLPTEQKLILKPGAQVMFIKNDSGEDRRYYNGKLAIVKSILKDEIIVTMTDGDYDLKLEKETWENVRYSLNKENGGLQEEVLGTFKQYPIRLAWAITIHKSQGLTFEKVIIDAGQSFAAGQVYVALSRCTTLDGMVLLSRISPRVIGTDERIVNFAKREAEEGELEEILEQERRNYLSDKLISLFRFEKFVKLFEEFCSYVPEKNIPEKQKAIELSMQLLATVKNQQDVADKFRVTIPGLIEGYENNGSDQLSERVSKALYWFGTNTRDQILDPLLDHFVEIQHASKVKKYKTYVGELLQAIELHLKKMFSAHYGDLSFCEDEHTYKTFIPQKTVSAQSKLRIKKPEKGNSHKMSLQFFNEGLSISEIAKMRNLAVSTIESHLVSFVAKGELDIYKLIPEEKIKTIVKVVESTSSRQSSDIKYLLGDDYSYAEIRAVLVWKFSSN